MRYEHESEETRASTKLTYLLVGGGIGALLALMFAPKSGHELRGDIADATRKGLEKSKETATLVGEKAGDYYEVTRERASGLYHTAQDKVGELSDRAREATARKNPISDAIDAGKEAYQEEKRRLESQTDTVKNTSTASTGDRVLELPKETNEGA